MEVFIVKMDDYRDTEFGYPNTEILGAFYSRRSADNFIGKVLDSIDRQDKKRVYFYVLPFTIVKD